MAQFDFSNIADLGSFWDGSSQAANWGGGTFNKFGGKAGIDHNLDLIYQNLLGRNADSRGKTYWSGEVANLGQAGYQNLINSIKDSVEYKDQQAELAANPNARAQDLKRLASAWVSPYHTYSGSAVGGWTPGDAMTEAVATAVSNQPGLAEANYGDQINKTVADVISDTLRHGGNATLGGNTGIIGGVDTAVATDLTTGEWKKIHDQTASVLGSGAIASNLAGGTTHTYVPGSTVTSGDGAVIGVAAGGGNEPGGGTKVVKADGTVVTIDSGGNVVTGTTGGTTGGTGPAGPQGPAGPAGASFDPSGIYSKFDDLAGILGDYKIQLADLQKAYTDNQQKQQDMWNQWQWDMNQTKNPQVRGVRTINELSDFKTGGTKGFFGRGGSNMLKTSSLNI